MVLDAVRSKAVVLLLLIVTPIVGFCSCFTVCFALACVHSILAIISIGKRELAALLCLSSWCLVIVVWLFLTIRWVILHFVIVVFPGLTHHFCFYSARVDSELLISRVRNVLKKIQYC